MKKYKKLSKCRLCGGKLVKQFTSSILGKYDASYFRCGRCDLIQTEKPYWLKEAYSTAIVDADTGLLSRNFVLSKITAAIIYFMFDKKEKHLDYAGGYGVLTRLMRDIGFNYYWDDPLSENIFTKGFESRKGDKYQIVTAFEFLEHIQDPIDKIKNIFNKYKNDAFLFSTLLYKVPINKGWWYLTPETGQHIAFYNIKTLRYIANELNLYLYSNGVNFHLLSKNKVNNLKFLLLTRFWPPFYLWCVVKMKSKTYKDHKSILKV